MGKNTNISWATHTMNFWLGCKKVGPACDNCYAEKWAKRAGWPELWDGQRRKTQTWDDPPKWNRAARKAGIRESVFSNSLADFFDNAVPEAWRDEAWEVIAACNSLDWYLVTKRIPNVEKMLPRPEAKGWKWCQENFGHVVIIITVVTQEEINRDVPRLLALKRAYPWLRVGLSIEPLLEPVSLRHVPMSAPSDAGVFRTVNALTGERGHMGPAGPTVDGTFMGPLDWVIVGGESGGRDVARPLNPIWARMLRDDCQRAGVPFHFKQYGTWEPVTASVNVCRDHGYFDGGRFVRVKNWGAIYDKRQSHVVMQTVGKDLTDNNKLDGRVYDAGPRMIAA